MGEARVNVGARAIAKYPRFLSCEHKNQIFIVYFVSCKWTGDTKVLSEQ